MEDWNAPSPICAVSKQEGKNLPKTLAEHGGIHSPDTSDPTGHAPFCHPGTRGVWGTREPGWQSRARSAGCSPPAMGLRGHKAFLANVPDMLSALTDMKECSRTSPQCLCLWLLVEMTPKDQDT